jgi:hypothetical protein
MDKIYKTEGLRRLALSMKGHKRNLGKKRTKEQRAKMSSWQKGKKLSENHKLKLKLSHLGNKHTEEQKEKIRKSCKKNAPKKEKHWNWKGGLFNNPYPKEFNSSLKLKIRKRDKFKCCLCGKTEREELEELNRVLCVNHIDFNKNNCGEKNLNTLCLRCNIRINREREYWTNFFQNVDTL